MIVYILGFLFTAWALCCIEYKYKEQKDRDFAEIGFISAFWPLTLIVILAMFLARLTIGDKK